MPEGPLPWRKRPFSFAQNKSAPAKPGRSVVASNNSLYGKCRLRAEDHAQRTGVVINRTRAAPARTVNTAILQSSSAEIERQANRPGVDIAAVEIRLAIAQRH